MNRERITDAELSEIRERADKATEGVADYGTGVLSLRREVIRQDVPKLLAEIDHLRAEIDRLCPIGDLDTITTLKTEIDYRNDIIADKDGEIERYREALEKILNNRQVFHLTRDDLITSFYEIARKGLEVDSDV